MRDVIISSQLDCSVPVHLYLRRPAGPSARATDVGPTESMVQNDNHRERPMFAGNNGCMRSLECLAANQCSFGRKDLVIEHPAIDVTNSDGISRGCFHLEILGDIR